MTLNEMVSMPLNEVADIPGFEFLSVLRVPGGWIYRNAATSPSAHTFVPEPTTKTEEPTVKRYTPEPITPELFKKAVWEFYICDKNAAILMDCIIGMTGIGIIDDALQYALRQSGIVQ